MFLFATAFVLCKKKDAIHEHRGCLSCRVQLRLRNRICKSLFIVHRLKEAGSSRVRESIRQPETFIPLGMGWIENYRRHETSETHGQGSTSIDAARQRWQQLGEELKADVQEFTVQHNGAEFSSSGDEVYRVSYNESGLELDITADFDAQVVRYD